MSRKAFFLLLIERIDSTRFIGGRLSEKSNIPQ